MEGTAEGSVEAVVGIYKGDSLHEGGSLYILNERGSLYEGGSLYIGDSLYETVEESVFPSLWRSLWRGRLVLVVGVGPGATSFRRFRALLGELHKISPNLAKFS